MSVFVHASPRDPCAWLAEELAADPGWTLKAGEEAHRDALRLDAWSRTQPKAETVYEHGAVNVPALWALGFRALDIMHRGRGLARIVGLDPGLDDSALRLAYLAVGLATGTALGNYGRLFDVKDRGEDYKASAAPVSMTREATSFHTDSSARDTLPDHVGLLCLRPARTGGESQVASAVAVHEALERSDPAALAVLYRSFHRDVVTPGTQRNLDRIRENRFPVFALDGSRGILTFRYMRYWIERAHALLETPLLAEEVAAFDLLDALLESTRHAFTFGLNRGEILWVDNRRLAHNRTAFEDAPDAPRTLVRMWTVDPAST